MARIALLADVHGNLEALEAVLRDLESVGSDAVVCLGDVVGYGPDPERCIDLVHASCDQFVMGNHDEAVVVEAAADLFNSHARRSIEFSRDRLGDWQLTLIKLMPYNVDIDDVAITHGSFANDRYDYLYTADAATRAFAGLRPRIGAVGHTHLPSVFTCALDDDPDAPPADVRVFPLAGDIRSRLPEDRRIIVNPGSVGQPRDRNPHASWGVLDTDAMIFEVRRVPYDVEAVSRRILDLGLPALHSQRLRMGA